MLARARGIGRSLRIYHGVPGRHRRLRSFYRQFLTAGDVGFDIGAHVGSRVLAWRSLGARVVAVEPQPDLVRVLRLLVGRDPGVIIRPEAAGAHAGRQQLWIATTTPTVSSMSADWREAVAADPSFARVRWDRTVEVPVVTLDGLIETYGMPAFVKIDVEGFETEVLAGLSRPVPALSMEYIPAAHADALAAVAQVEQLGAGTDGYRYNFSPVETMRLATDSWLDAAGLERLLDQVRPGGRSGDIYARLRTRD